MECCIRCRLCSWAVDVLHDPNLTHPLKEVDAAALAVAESPEQVVKILAYVLSGRCDWFTILVVIKKSDEFTNQKPAIGDFW